MDGHPASGPPVDPAGMRVPTGPAPGARKNTGHLAFGSYTDIITHLARQGFVVVAQDGFNAMLDELGALRSECERLKSGIIDIANQIDPHGYDQLYDLAGVDDATR